MNVIILGIILSAGIIVGLSCLLGVYFVTSTFFRKATPLNVNDHFKRIVLRTIMCIFYCTSISLLIFYILLDMSPVILIPPSGRLVLLGLICIGIYFGNIFISRTMSKQTSTRIINTSFWFFFALYIVLLINFTLFEQMFGRKNSIDYVYKVNSEAFHIYLKNSVNLIPFKTIFEYIKGLFSERISAKIVVINILGNLAAFVPFAFFIPLLIKSVNKYISFLFFVLLIALLVELLQLFFMKGACDIDDIILNVGGASLFYAVFQIKIIKNIISKITFQEN